MTTEGPIHEMVRVYRAQENIDQKDLAEWIGIQPSSLCRFEKGRQLDAIHTIKIINWLFGLA
jgi:DNA-binding XRE family transcriptional regulator